MRLFKKESILPLLILSLLLIVNLGFMSQTIESATQYSRFYTLQLIASMICFVLLFGLVAFYLTQLFLSVHKGRIGAKLNARMMMFFSGLSLFPLVMLFVFSVSMINRGIDSWFDESLDKGFEDALALAQSALDTRRLDALRLTQYAGERLSRTAPIDIPYYIENLRIELNALELSVFDLRGNFIATSSGDLANLLPERPSEVIMLSVAQGMEYVPLEPINNNEQYRVRAVIRVDGPTSYIIQAFYEIPDRYTELGNSTQKSVEYYKQYKALRAPFKMNLIGLLSMVALLSVLLALGGSFFAARRLVNPIRKLSIATQAVADGDLTRSIRVKSKDEIGFLTQSFNEMTKKLRLAHDTAQDSQRMLETQRAHLASVLAKLSSGVLVIDMVGRIRTYNNAALAILKIERSVLNEISLKSSDPIPQSVESFFTPILPYLTDNDDWRIEISRFYDGAQQILSVRGAQQKDQIGLMGGHIIVFDDITYLISAERESAWSEVARRLAHEIKNPLTPIQLSAERLRLRFLDKFIDRDREIIDKSTQTIIAQVGAMKAMVDEFSQYARAPKLNLETLELNALVTDVLYLYQDYPVGIEIELNLAAEKIVLLGDNIRLRQLLHNLVKNALEACQKDIGTVTVTTSLEETRAVLEIKDTGIGFDEDLIKNIFEPYVTTKVKGTGLGLAIVKKIVEEHGGAISIYSAPEEVGARIVIQLPLINEKNLVI